MSKYGNELTYKSDYVFIPTQLVSTRRGKQLHIESLVHLELD